MRNRENDRIQDESRWNMNEPSLRSSRDDERTWRDDWRPGRFSHAGKGPKGYTRSDDRIREDVSDALTDDGRIDASEIEVDVTTGQVTLSGSVESRDMKRAAEDLVDGISGVNDVQNLLRVTPRGSSRSSETRATSSSTSSETSQRKRKGSNSRTKKHR